MIRREKTNADGFHPVKNLPRTDRIHPPQYADRCFDLGGVGPGMTQYQKIRGQMKEDIGNQMLMKQRIHKPAYLTQDQIASTPGYRSKDLTSGRNLKSRK